MENINCEKIYKREDMTTLTFRLTKEEKKLIKSISIVTEMSIQDILRECIKSLSDEL